MGSQPIRRLFTLGLLRIGAVAALMSALLLFWTGRMWLMAHRGNIHGDPVVYALRDRLSRIVGVSTVAILLYAT